MFYLQNKFRHLIFKHIVEKCDLEIQMDTHTHMTMTIPYSVPHAGSQGRANLHPAIRWGTNAYTHCTKIYYT